MCRKTARTAIAGGSNAVVLQSSAKSALISPRPPRITPLLIAVVVASPVLVEAKPTNVVKLPRFPVSACRVRPGATVREDAILQHCIGLAGKPTEGLWLTSPRAAIDARLAGSRLQSVARKLRVAKPATHESAEQRARRFINAIRNSGEAKQLPTAVLTYLPLNSRPGLALFLFAEAYLRTPTGEGRRRLVENLATLEVFPSATQLKDDWSISLDASAPLRLRLLVAALRGLGAAIHAARGTGMAAGLARKALPDALARAEEQVDLAIPELANHYILGQSIGEARDRSTGAAKKGYRFSFDMLGEGARTDAQAQKYLADYKAAIKALPDPRPGEKLMDRPGISIKLSALHPRFEMSQRQRVRKELVPRVVGLAKMAAEKNITLTVDAEEARRLQLTADVLSGVSDALRGTEAASWQGLGVAVQAYQRHALGFLQHLDALADSHGRRWTVRLVKGAYLDAEFQEAQDLGLPIPTWQRKSHADVAYLACAEYLLQRHENFYPQFATHNADTVSRILEKIEAHGLREAGDFEFQRLQGMGEALHDYLLREEGLKSRIYAPVGEHVTLLPYLLRRLLENSASVAFVNKVYRRGVSVEELTQHPVTLAEAEQSMLDPKIRQPDELYAPRRNSISADLDDPEVLQAVLASMGAAAERTYKAAPTGSQQRVQDTTPAEVFNPAHPEQVVGALRAATDDEVDAAIAAAKAASAQWRNTHFEERAKVLERFADLMQENHGELMHLIVAEGGRTLRDADNEIREAIDFSRSHAMFARQAFKKSLDDRQVGRLVEQFMRGRGVAGTISPWNFPLAIGVGQLTGALAAGNSAVVKPASDTPLVMARAIDLLYKAGLPEDVLQLLPGSGSQVGQRIARDPRISSLAFTGSTEVAVGLDKALAGREKVIDGQLVRGGFARRVFETGGVNAMIVDSTAMLEQVIDSVIKSAFLSAGQRCSALRTLYLPRSQFEEYKKHIIGAMRELKIGDPRDYSTDVGPVINQRERDQLMAFINSNGIDKNGLETIQMPLTPAQERGNYVPPTLIIDPEGREARLGIEEGEHFGPILRLVAYEDGQLDPVIDQINATQSGLTLGVHTRDPRWIQLLEDRLHVGNVYFNRDMVGAIPGYEGFGGAQRSGAGRKAGTLGYIAEFADDITRSIFSLATGGSAQFFVQEEQSN